jgi:hypothetical protein
MPIDLLPNVAKPYTLPRHEGQADAPRFHLRPLTSRTAIELSTSDSMGTAMFAAVVAALVGIDGVTMAGESLPSEPQPPQRVDSITIPAGSVAAGVVERLPRAWVLELATEVSRRNNLNEDDGGK